MPAIPNRWFILRLVPPKDKTTKELGLRAWIVESDHVASPDDESPMTGNAWPSPRLRQSAGSVKKQDYWIRVGKAFNYGGQGLPEPQWTEENSGKSLARSVVDETGKSPFSIRLTAIGYGDPAFCASYRACRNLLGFHDPLNDDVLAGASEDNPVALTYLVAGWYANPADDPLHGYTGDKWNSRLGELRWKTHDGFDLQLMSSLNDGSDPPGKRLIIVADVDQVLHFRIFDGDGKMVVDTNEKRLTEQARQIEDLRKKLVGLWPPRELTESEKAPVIAIVTSIVGHTPHDQSAQRPNQILCHGLIQGVKWQGKAVNYLAPPNLVPPSPVRPNQVALGNNDVEALTAVLSASFKELADSKFADLFAAFQFNVLTGLAQPGGDHELTASLHERTFGRYPGGTRWEIVESPGAAAQSSTDRSGKETATVVPERVGRALRLLNDAQRSLDRAEQELRSYQEEIYATWYKSFLASADNTLKQKWALSLQKRLAWLRDDRIEASRDRIGKERAACVARKNELKAELKVFLPGFQLQAGSEPYFHAPNDPVVLISGDVARVSRRHGEDGRYSKDGKTLLCRYENQTISSWTVTAPTRSQKVPITAANLNLPGSASFPKGRPIPRAIAKDLFPETLLLEPSLTWWLAEVAKTGGGTEVMWEHTLDRVLKLLGQKSRHKDNDFVPPREIWIQGKDAPDRGWPIVTPKPDERDLGQVRFETRFPSAVALNSWSQNPWLPLHMVWEVAWQAFASEPKEMLGGWSLDPDRIAFTFQSNGGTTPPAARRSYQGLTVLTPGGTVSLESRLRERLDVASSTELREIYEKICETDVLSQSLSGFTEQLVMKKMRPELPLLDPKTVIPGFEVIKKTEEGRVTEGIQRDLAPDATKERFDPIPKISPVPPLALDPSEAVFFPIRAGTLEVVRLVIVDAFGRMRKLDIKETMRSPRLTPPGPSGGARPPRIFLEPRLSSPARLVMQWRNPAAADEPAVCGWLLPNILDRSFVVLDALGRALGTLQRRQPNPLKMGSGQADALESKDFAWVPIPPMKMPADPADPLPTDRARSAHDVYLGGFIRSLLALKGERGRVYDQLFSGLETTQGGVNQPSSARSPNLAALMGRPLAMVRASLRLELAGLGPLAQGWDKLEILDPKEGMLGLDKVEFPVSLGHPVPGLDGLVGYFVLSRSDPTSAQEFDPLYMAFGLEGTDSEYVKYKSKSSAQQVSLSRPLELLLLMYPEGGVTVTTGILPRQTFRPESSDGGADLEESDVYFYTGPVVSPEAELRIPRPSDAYGQWSWTHRQEIDIWAQEEKLDGRHKGTEQGKDKGTEQPLQDLLQLREGWLKLVAYPLAIHNFRVEGREPKNDQETPLRFDVPGDNGYVLAWTVSGADRVELTREGRPEPLFKSLTRPHPAPTPSRRRPKAAPPRPPTRSPHRERMAPPNGRPSS